MAKKGNTKSVSSLIYIIVGILLIAFRTQMLNIAMTIAGIVFIILGIIDIVKKNTGSGAISLIIGIAILVLGWLAVGIVLLVLGILIAVKGVILLIEVFGKKKKKNSDILFAVVSIVVGIMLAFGNALDIMIIAVGILLIVDGIIGLASAKK